MISPQKGVWHCFVCGAGGDIFKFVTEYENITKREALEKLAKKAGVTLPKREKLENNNIDSSQSENPEVSDFEKGLKILSWSASTYHKILLKILQDRSHPITMYCLERNLTQEIIEKFQLGYAPKGNFMVNLAVKYALDASLMVSTGILRNTEEELENVIRSQKSLKDKFTDRLLIPIQDKQGRVIGFTGRNLPYDKSERPRYLNSSQSQWFNKSELWFGWHLAKKRITQEKKAVLVEGNMDVIAAFKAGLDITLASQGTSFTQQQLKILKTLTKVIWLAFDNDEAGIAAGYKLFKEASVMGFELHKVVIPMEFKDLDEYLNSQEKVDLQTLPYLDWVLKMKFGILKSPNSDEQKKAILETVDLIKSVDTLSQEQYLKKLAEITKISLTTLQSIGAQVFESRVNKKNELIEKKQVSTEQNILVSFENLVAGSTASENSFKLQDMFCVLQKLIPALGEFVSFQEYLDSNKSVLELIVSQKEEYFEEGFMEKLWQLLTHYIDQNLTQIILDSVAKEAYYKLKKSDS